MREASESSHAKVREKVTRASAAWMFSILEAQCTSVLHGVFSRLQAPSRSLQEESPCKKSPDHDSSSCSSLREALPCAQAAAVGSLAAQLSGLQRASRFRALGTWRLQAAGCRGRRACIAAGAARSEWACRQSSRRTLQEALARLRPAPVPEASLRHLAALHRSLVKHRLSSGFHSWRLQVAAAASETEAQCSESQTDSTTTDEECCKESQTDSTTCSSVATQASGPERRSAFVQTDDPEVEWLAEVARSPSDSSRSEVGSSSNLPYIGDAVSKPEAEQAGHSEEKPSSCVGKLDFSQLERQLDRAASVVSSVRSGLSNLEGRVSRAGSVASSQVPSLHASRNPSRSPSPVPHAGNVSLEEELLQRQADTQAAAARAEERREEERRQQEWNEKQAFELRWWRTLADLVAGSDTESSPSETLRYDSETSLHRGLQQPINGGTGSSYDDRGNTSCSSGGSTDSDVDASLLLASAFPAHSEAVCRSFHCKGDMPMDLDAFSAMGRRSLPLGTSRIPYGGGTGDPSSPVPVFQEGNAREESPALRSLAHPNVFCQSPDCPTEFSSASTPAASRHLAWLASRTLPTPPSSCSSTGLPGHSLLLSSLPGFPSPPSGLRSGIGTSAGTVTGSGGGMSASPSLSLSPLPTYPVSTSA